MIIYVRQGVSLPRLLVVATYTLEGVSPEVDGVPSDIDAIWDIGYPITYRISYNDVFERLNLF